MAEPPWSPERTVSPELARALVETQFPALAPARVTAFGVGWDNTAYLVNDRWVFRFPRREIAVALMEREARLLPHLAGMLPLPIPRPVFVGQPEERFPWPFAGYEMLSGRTACVAGLDGPGRRALAPAVGAFLAALHAVDPETAGDLGAEPDEIRRLDLGHRSPQIESRLQQCVATGLLADTRPWLAIIHEAPADWSPAGDTLVHGDLYVRHLLVDDDGRACGVIDWGDVHLGDPATDLAIAEGFLPPSARAAFEDAYGTVRDETRRMARFKALHCGLAILVYGKDSDDSALLREGHIALAHLAGREDHVT